MILKHCEELRHFRSTHSVWAEAVCDAFHWSPRNGPNHQLQLSAFAFQIFYSNWTLLLCFNASSRRLFHSSAISLQQFCCARMPPKLGAAAKGKAAVAAPSKSKKKCTISDADARNLQKTFSEYDTDGSGEISLIELQQFFAKSSTELWVPDSVAASLLFVQASSFWTNLHIQFQERQCCRFHFNFG